MLSNRRRVRPWLTLAAFLCTFVLPVAGADHDAAADDPACVAAPATAAGGGGRVDDSSEGAVPEHCPLCHFQRAAGGAAPTHHTGISAPAGHAVRVSIPPAIENLRAAQAQAPRAPPSLL